MIFKYELVEAINSLSVDLYHAISTIEHLELEVHALRKEVTKLRKPVTVKSKESGKKLEKAIKDVATPKRGRGRPRKNK